MTRVITIIVITITVITIIVIPIIVLTITTTIVITINVIIAISIIIIIIIITLIIMVMTSTNITWLHLSSTLTKTSWLGSLSNSIYETPTLISSFKMWLQFFQVLLISKLKSSFALGEWVDIVCVYGFTTLTFMNFQPAQFNFQPSTRQLR